ncbi:hypothetical protein HETIRDRAFT_438567 [Heterobasidion irregulare TC 32-1]|uniref:OTU domain-containing protein n=1 Tax=Heterobasidion irregulare (strain TC 32-1) TaxID=747525 RepID=W4KJZ9_HETIT|nr:uncharacterized protein HETIRDRAFT_438567 [Heterobasidion irregulare TC 32-1]ETW86029.1 hypothetical protein HETIRDRAFT_438567 [Heterobasidion irregulare TC 32-1]
MGSRKNKSKKNIPTPPIAPLDDADNEQLMDDLLAQLDSQDKTVQQESAAVLNEMQISQIANEDSNKKNSSRDRFKERQARKAAALAQQQTPVDKDADARLERETKEEEKSITRTCNELGVEMHEINPDGHCLYAAISDQLSLLGVIPPAQANFAIIREAAANYIYTHPNDFLPFLPSVLGEDGLGTSQAGIMGPREFEAYCATIRDTATWGGEPEILALSKAYGIPIHVVQGGSPPVVVHDPTGAPRTDNLKDQKAVRVSYHRRMYGLGEHYNSLRPKGGLHRVTSPIKNLLP